MYVETVALCFGSHDLFVDESGLNELLEKSGQHENVALCTEHLHGRALAVSYLFGRNLTLSERVSCERVACRSTFAHEDIYNPTLKRLCGESGGVWGGGKAWLKGEGEDEGAAKKVVALSFQVLPASSASFLLLSRDKKRRRMNKRNHHTHFFTEANIEQPVRLP